MLYERQFIVAPEAGSRTFRMTCPRSRRQNQEPIRKLHQKFLYVTEVLKIRILLGPRSGSTNTRYRTDPDPAPDPSIISKNSKKNFDSYCF
jgi:hypothetical protein